MMSFKKFKAVWSVIYIKYFILWNYSEKEKRELLDEIKNNQWDELQKKK